MSNFGIAALETAEPITAGEAAQLEGDARSQSLVRHFVQRKRAEREANRILDAEERGGAGAASWAPVAMSAVSSTPIEPTVGSRSDGVRVFYKGALNIVFGESEGGKTWLCLHQVAELINAGKKVVMLDYEDGPQAAKIRLMALGVPAPLINNPNFFVYINPQAPLDDEAFKELKETLASAEMVLIDAFSEAAALEGVDDYRAVAVAGWYTRFPRRIAALGPAVVLIDHVNKSADTQKQQSGSQHKKAGVDGVSLKVSPIAQFAEGKGGASMVYVSKDRHSGVKKHAVRSEKGESMRFAVLKCDDFGTWKLDPASEPVDAESKAAAKDHMLREVVDAVLADKSVPRKRGSDWQVAAGVMREEVRTRFGSCDNTDIDEAYAAVKKAQKDAAETC
jgi:hypothetical protein